LFVSVSSVICLPHIWTVMFCDSQMLVYVYRLKELEEQYAKEKAATERQFEKQRQVYASTWDCCGFCRSDAVLVGRPAMSVH